MKGRLLDADIAEGNKHIEMSDDFPFDGHGSAEEDLLAIKKDIDTNKMPPTKYWLLHWKARITSDEKKAVEEWIESSVQILKSN